MPKIISAIPPKQKIHSFITNNPGTHLRKMKKTLGFSMGTIQYHIYELEKEGKITSIKNGFYRNFYGINIKEENNKVMSLLNLESPRKIIFYILKNEPCNNNQIANGVGLASSTVSWHMKKLAELNIIERKYNGKFSIYRIKNKESILPLLSHYSSSTWNQMMSNMTDLFATFQD